MNKYECLTKFMKQKSASLNLFLLSDDITEIPLSSLSLLSIWDALSTSMRINIDCWEIATVESSFFYGTNCWPFSLSKQHSKSLVLSHSTSIKITSLFICRRHYKTAPFWA